MTVVQVEEHERLDRALKAFRRKVQRSGILRDLRRKRYYVKPSESRRLKAAAAERRRRKRHRRSAGNH